MQPDQQPQYSIDYLEQISTASPKKSVMNEKLFIFAIIAGIVAVLLVGVLAILGSGTSNKDNMMRLAARLQTLQTISDAAKANVTSTDLRGTNTNLSLSLTNANRDIVTPLQNNDVNAAKLDAKIVASEDGSDLKTRLENARISGYFDRTYAREMSDQLATLIALTKEIEARTKSKSLKEYLTATQSQLDPLQKQFADFNAANT